MVTFPSGGSHSDVDALQRVRLLGALRIENAQGAIRVVGSKAQSLFAYLLLHPSVPHPRETLADRLWPKSPPDRVRRNFSDTLYRLRQTLGSDWLVVERERIALHPKLSFWVDVWEFERLCQADDPVSLQRAVTLYAGELLPEIYDDWILTWRVSLHERYLTCLSKLGQLAEKDHQPELSLDYYQRLADEDPLREQAYRGLMRSLASTDRLTDALEVYAKLGHVLESELGVEPSEETRVLADRLRGEFELTRKATALQSDSLSHPPFVGRIQERATALEAVEAAIAGHGGFLAIEGEAGIGKSRLLQEIAAGARWRGVTVVTGNATVYPAASPLSPLVGVLSTALTGPRASQMETILPAKTLAALAPLHPPWKDMTLLPDLAPPQARHRFHQALVAMCQAVASLSPHLLTLDDLQWADPALWETLDALVPILDQSRLLVLLAYRRPEIEQNVGWSAIQRWEREDHLKVFSLEPLDEQEVAELLPPDLATEAKWVLACTGGNPFHITDMLVTLAEGHGPHCGAAVDRADALSEPARAALQVAAVIGAEVPYHLWAAMTHLSPLELAEASQELTTHHFLRPTEAGYVFAHGLVHTAIYESIDPRCRRRFHRRVADALITDDDRNLRALAFHLDRAGAAEEAARVYLQAGTQDLSLFAFAEAQSAFARALALVPTALTRERIETLLALAQVCDVTGDREQQEAALAEAMQNIDALEQALAMQVLVLNGDFAAKTDRHEQAFVHLNRALTLAKRMGDHTQQIEILLSLGDLAVRQCQWPEAADRFETALALARDLGQGQYETHALDGLGYVATNLRQTSHSAVDHCEQVPLNRAIAEAHGDLPQESHYITVTLARGDAPLGRPLTSEEMIPIHWTLRDPADELIANKATRRRHVLQRLLAEARAQGAAPTDDDLAGALGVSRRTILRDMQALAQSSQELPTRKRKRSA